MTSLNATIVIEDKISKSILDKIDAIGSKAENAAFKIKAMQDSMKGTARVSAGGLLRERAEKSTQGNVAVRAARAQTGSRNVMKLQGLSQAQRDLAKLDRTMQQMTNSSRAFIAAMAFGSVASGILALGESYTKLTNKLTLVSSTLDQAKGKFATLTAIGNATYTSVDALVPLFTRLDLALKQIGTSTSDVYQVTENLSKAITLSGLSTAEMNSVLTQVSQAFNKGKLDGDEFRSVMENMPLLADAIAKKLKVTRGELLKLAPDGKITAQIMRDAILDMTDTIDSKFRELTPTVGMHLARLQNQVTSYFGGIMANVDFSNKIGAILDFIGKHLDTITKVGVSLAAIMATAFAVTPIIRFAVGLTRIIMAVRAAQGALSVFLALAGTNPFTLAIAGATALFGVLTGVKALSGENIFGVNDADVQKADDLHSRLKEILDTKEKLSRTQALSFEKDAGEAVAIYKERLSELADKSVKLAQEQTTLTRVVKDNEQGFGEAAQTASAWSGEIMTAKISAQELAENKKKLAEVTKEASKSTQEYVQTLIKTHDIMQGQVDILLEQEKRQREYINDLRAQKKASDDAGYANNYLNDTLAAAEAAFADLQTRILAAEDQLRSFLTVSNSAGSSSAILQSATNAAIITVEKIRAQREADEKMLLNLVELGKVSVKADRTGKSEAQIRKEERNAKIIEESKQRQAVIDRSLLKGTIMRIEAERGLKNEQAARLKQSEEEYQKELDAGKPKKKGSGGGKHKGAKEKLTEEQKALKEANKDWQAYIENIKSERELLNIGYDNYTRFLDLYKEVNKARAGGVTIQESEIAKLKEQIQANERLKESMEWRKRFEDATPKAKREEWERKYNVVKSLQKDNPEAHAKGQQELFKDMGIDTFNNFGFDFTTLESEAKNSFARINQMWKDGQIGFREYMSSNAQIVSQTWSGATDNLQNTFANISKLQMSENAKVARVGKAAAIANATMGAITSSINAYASAAAIPYVGYIMAPVAAAAALAAGMANVAQIRSQPTGYYVGGYTGNKNPKTAIQTNLHGGEYVFDHKTTEDIGLNKLDALRNGTAFIQHRGEELKNQTQSAPNVNITVENYGKNKVEVQQIDPYNIKVLIQEELQTSGQTIVSDYLKSENGREQVAKIAQRSK